MPAGKFQPLSIPSSNSNKMVRANPVPASVFSLHNPGRIFQEKMHLCAYKMSPLRVILSADRNISHEVYFSAVCLINTFLEMLLSGLLAVLHKLCHLRGGVVKRVGSICNQHFGAMPIRTIYKSCIWQFPPQQLQSLQPALGEASNRLETKARAQ